MNSLQLPRILSIVLVELDVLAKKELQLPFIQVIKEEPCRLFSVMSDVDSMRLVFSVMLFAYCDIIAYWGSMYEKDLLDITSLYI